MREDISIKEALVIQMSDLSKLVASRPRSGWHETGLVLAGAGSKTGKVLSDGQTAPFTTIWAVDLPLLQR